MEENKYDYKPEEEKFDYIPEFEEDDYDQEFEHNDAIKKSLLGYRVVVLLLIVILAGVSVLYFNLNRQQQQTMSAMEQEHKELEIERDTIANNFASLREEYAALGVKNDSIAAELKKGDSIIAQLKKERRLNYSTIKKYQKEVGTLRAVMKTYLGQIDSLNKANKKLSGENITLRKEISTEKLRADKAEEREKELENKVGFTIAANELAQPGNRQVYLCIYGPDGYLIGSSSFSHNGKAKSCSASRQVDYQNEDLDVNIFYHGSGKDFLPGKYKIELYMDGGLLGRTTRELE